MKEFLRSHLPRCRCPRPGAEGSAGLSRVAASVGGVLAKPEADKGTGCQDWLRRARWIDSWLPMTDTWSEFAVCPPRLVGGDGSCARQFLAGGLAAGNPGWNGSRPSRCRGLCFCGRAELGPTGIRALVVHLRSFLRFLEFSGRLRAGTRRSCAPAGATASSAATTNAGTQAVAKVLEQFSSVHSARATRLTPSSCVWPSWLCEARKSLV